MNAPALFRFVLCLVLLCLGLAARPASAGIMESAKFRTALKTNTPAAQLVPMTGDHAAMRAADQFVAVRGPKKYQSFQGIGESMEPVYTQGTALVIRRTTCDEVKRGMTVVYFWRNAYGLPVYVAHVVVGEDGKGFMVQGVNNPEPDARSVNESNLIGVVVAAFTPVRVLPGPLVVMQ